MKRGKYFPWIILITIEALLILTIYYLQPCCEPCLGEGEPCPPCIDDSQIVVAVIAILFPIFFVVSRLKKDKSIQ